jgi:large subunit ribosomal protein L13
MSRPAAIQKTFSITKEAARDQRRWFLVDAENQILGNVAQKVANLLRGKEKAIFTPHIDCGDYVVVVNAEKVRLTGKKETQKTYMTFSGYVGGHKSETVKARRARRPTLLIEKAVWGMIPKNRLGRRIITKLKVYAGSEHPHAANQPQPIPASALA